jgi:hypothetical protein
MFGGLAPALLRDAFVELGSQGAIRSSVGFLRSTEASTATTQATSASEAEGYRFESCRGYFQWGVLSAMLPGSSRPSPQHVATYATS